jgi:hypothetical protein
VPPVCGRSCPAGGGDQIADRGQVTMYVAQADVAGERHRSERQREVGFAVALGEPLLDLEGAGQGIGVVDGIEALRILRDGRKGGELPAVLEGARLRQVAARQAGEISRGEIAVGIDRQVLAHLRGGDAPARTDVRPQRILGRVLIVIAHAGLEGLERAGVHLVGPVVAHRGGVRLRPVQVVEEDREAQLRRIAEIDAVDLIAAEVALGEIEIDAGRDAGDRLQPEIILMVGRGRAVVGHLGAAVQTVGEREFALQRRRPDGGFGVCELGVGQHRARGRSREQDVVGRIGGIAQP